MNDIVNQVVKYCQENKFKHKSGHFYSQIVTKEGHNTRAWKRERIDFSEVNYIMKNRQKFMEEIQQGLDKHPDITFPQEPDPSIIAWDDGILFGHLPAFVTYDSKELKNVNIVANHYIAQKFGHYVNDKGQFVNTETKEIVTDETKTALDVVLNHQRFTREQQNILFALMFGRPLAQEDSWTKATFLYGTARAGKGVILDILHMLFPSSLTRLVSGHSEWHWLGNLLQGAQIMSFFDTQERFNMPPETLLDIIKGREMKLRIKGEGIQPMTQVTAPVFFAGNGVPRNWQGTDVVNHIVMFKFLIKVNAVDRSIKQRCEQDLGTIVAKGLSAYRQLIRECGTDCIDEIVKKNGLIL